MKGIICIFLISLTISENIYSEIKKNEADAFRQSQKLLKFAANELVETITKVDYPMLKDFPERKKILLNILPYENLVKFPGKDEIYKDGVLLSMDHQINPNQIMLYKPFFVMYAGTSDSEFEKKAVEVKKDLLMEASLTWGINEKEAEAFADDFLQLKKATASSTKLRPENSVFIKPDYCSCLDGKRDILNQCEAFCKGTYGGPTLYGSVILGEKIIMDDTLGSLERWCNAEISGVPGACKLEVNNGVSKEYLDMDIPANSNNFSVNVNTLKQNVTYVARIVETGSNTNRASSDTFQIRRIPPPPSAAIFPGPLKITPINQYTCISRVGPSDPNTNSNYFELKATNHYYYDPRQKPPVGPPNAFVYCYDRDQYGPIDRITYPRLELVPKALSLWDQTDIRFSDTNGDGQMDINTLIDTEMLIIYGVTAKTDYFVPFKWPVAPSIAVDSGETTIGTLGYIMRVFIDPYTGVGKCPTQEDYFGPDVTFKALRGVVGVDTEAIYIGARDKEILTNPDGTTTESPPDIILIRESLLKKIWFYYENNLAIKPDDVTSIQMTTHFFYPPNLEDPFIQKSYQTLYTVRDRSSFSEATPEAGTGGTVQSLPSYDKRFGCIPANIENQVNINKPQTNNSNSEIKNPTPETPAPSIPTSQQIPYSSVGESTPPNKVLYWYTNKAGNPLTISSNVTNSTFIRGTLINDYLQATDPTTNIPNWQRTYCLVVSYITEGAKQQLRARAIPITIGNLKDNTMEQLLRIDWPSDGKNKELCNGDLPTYNQLATQVSTTSDVAFTPLDLCPACPGTIYSTNISLYFENVLPNGTPGELTIANRVPIAQFDPSVLYAGVDFTISGAFTSKCTQSECMDNGYDCCVEGQCVKDKKEKAGAPQNPEYYQAKKDVALNPSSYLNYPQIFNICPIPGYSNPVTKPEESSTEQEEALVRFNVQKAQYYCQEEGKQQNPNFELYCNNKYLCTNLWKKSEPSFNGNCADLDRRNGSDRYKENKINIWKICGCRAEDFPNSPDDKRCPDFNLRAIRNINEDITEIVCSVTPNSK